MQDPLAGQLERSHWSPNTISLNATLGQRTRVLINQNWHPGWKSNVGTVLSHEGLLAIDLPQGSHQLRLRFLPRSAIGGFLSSLSALLVLCYLIYSLHKHSKYGPRQLAALAIPLVVFAACRLGIQEASQPAPPPVNANGVRALSSALPEASQALNIEYELPVKLKGLRFADTIQRSSLFELELDWQRYGSIPRSVGVFVHLISPSGYTINSDHWAIASSFILRNAPKNIILRDIVSFRIPANAEKGIWTLRAGLWNIGSDKKRIPITNQAHKNENDVTSLGTIEVR
ncbi:MAG: hypothetical protein IPJ88_18095 [Myxococcales bacterium]|nr:MAG: hypothetical protein IPJ88_18095 [Myxococcales bacterium]